jgi:hypothetical protein
MTARWLCLVLVAACCPTLTVAQNSTRKIRKPPGELAAKAGSGVQWRDGVEAALAESKKTGKPVFWYVPSVHRSPMDRKPEVDRYMMGGPFSWPATVVLLNQHYVPVREVARGELAKKYGLSRIAYIEPGYLVLDGDGEQQLAVQQLTTFHPRHFLGPLLRLAEQPELPFAFAGVRPETAKAVGRGDWREVLELVARPTDDLVTPAPKGGLFAEQHWLRGVAMFRLGRREDALDAWRKLVRFYPDHPLGWKAALEIENHGPFVHGFEVYADLPHWAVAGDPTDGTRAPEGHYREPELWARSVRFLLGAHDDDGVYRDSTYDFGGTDGLPNVHAAVTCLVGEALLAATARARNGELDLDAALLERAEAQLLRMRANAMQSDWLALSDRDEIVWARAYALRFLEAWQRRRSGDAEALEPGIRRGVAALIALQPETGVWFHEYGNPFAIATALQALHGARQLGFEVPQDNIDRGLKALAFNRTKEGAFSYGQTRPGRAPRASLEAAGGRMPLCELALYLFGASDQQKLTAAVETGERFHSLLAEVRKYDDHANRYGYGGFFFWFDMLGRAEAIAEIEDADKRRALAAALHEKVLALPEFDGCFVDSHELGRCYGTAMALLTLDTLR